MASSPSSLSPPPVPMELHVGNREKLLRSIRKYLTKSKVPVEGFVFLQGGEAQKKYCTDHLELFRQESYYYAYLFGVREPGFYGAIMNQLNKWVKNHPVMINRVDCDHALVLMKDIATEESILFTPRLPEDYGVWMGEIKPLSYFQERYMVSKAYYVDEIIGALHDRYKGPSDKAIAISFARA